MRIVAYAAVVTALLTGCGGDTTTPEDVVRAWSRALNAGDNESAADLFARGARVIQSGRVLRLTTRADAVAWNAALPCSGRIVELATDGDTVTATFLLDDRPASACDAPGARATAAFRIEDGRIVLWHQLGSAPPRGTEA
jgi:limonene-1,2-epoxide hydrolase